MRSELAKSVAEIIGAERDPLYVKDVAMAISLMMGAGLKTWGHKPENALDSWYLALISRGIERHELALATTAFVSGMCGADFPQPGRFADWVIEQRGWVFSHDQLLAVATEAKREDEERAVAFEARMIERYGDCSLATVKRHLAGLVDGIERRQLRPIGEKVPQAVKDELEDMRLRRSEGQPYRRVEDEGKEPGEAKEDR